MRVEDLGSTKDLAFQIRRIRSSTQGSDLGLGVRGQGAGVRGQSYECIVGGSRFGIQSSGFMFLRRHCMGLSVRNVDSRLLGTEYSNPRCSRVVHLSHHSGGSDALEQCFLGIKELSPSPPLPLTLSLSLSLPPSPPPPPPPQPPPPLLSPPPASPLPPLSGASAPSQRAQTRAQQPHAEPGLGFRGQGLRLMIYGLGYRVWSAGFRL